MALHIQYNEVIVICMYYDVQVKHNLKQFRKKWGWGGAGNKP